MNNFLLNPIGIMYISSNSHIELETKYVKATKNLDGFSHIHLLFIVDGVLKEEIVKIISIVKNIIEISTKRIYEGEYPLFDIKPYMPSEDIVKDEIGFVNKETYPITITKEENGYSLSKFGLIRKVNNVMYIELSETLSVTAKYLKVIWWFSMFDKKKYRDIVECKPPYESLDKVGIFSTRSPVRPNPLALTIVKVKKLKDNRIYISDMEAYDKTPCLGIIVYDFNNDIVDDYYLPDYLKYWPKAIDFSETRKFIDDDILLESPLHDLLNRKHQNNLDLVDGANKEGNSIYVKGARVNNLKEINVEIPYNEITAVVGVSGSGKSSLVNDTIYLECKRKMEFLNQTKNVMSKPDVDEINGCIPAVIIKQNPIRGNSLSTVGTYVNIYDHLRIIYSTLGVIHCPDCLNEINVLSKTEIRKLISGLTEYDLFSINGEKIEKKDIDNELQKNGVIRLSVNKQDYILQTTNKCHHCNKVFFDLSPQVFSYINPDSRCPKCNGLGEEVVVDENKLVDNPDLSLMDGAISFYGKLSNFLKMPNANWMKGQVFGLARLLNVDLNERYIDLPDEFKNALIYGDKREVTFAFHNKKNGRNGVITRPVEGLKAIIYRCYNDASTPTTLAKYMKRIKCKECNGERLDSIGRLVTVNNVRYPIAAKLSFEELDIFCNELLYNISQVEFEKVKNSIRSIKEIIDGAKKLGISYLNLDRSTSNLSVGEAQRLKLLTASVNHLSNILYIFDEPSKGLDKRDYDKVIQLLQSLKKENNTILMVEHNPDMIKKADNIIEIGPGAGKSGGYVVGSGTLDELLKNCNTQISKYWNKQLSSKRNVDVDTYDFVIMKELNFNNLRNIEIRFPKNAITCIYGVSGSGKSSLMNGEIYPKMLMSNTFNEVIIVDQTPIGKNSKSIVATYISIMDDIRKIFSDTESAKGKNIGYANFSFNNEIGQCEACKGDGKIEIKYVDNAYTTCQVCNGKRYKKEVLSVKYNSLDISEVLNLSITDGISFFKDNKEIVEKLDALVNVGLGYLKIGQVTSTLSGGEASRLKIASRLINGKKSNMNNLYLLDEPTTGLHFSDIENLAKLLNSLVENNNTIIAIEHNTSFINMSDWKIELGPKAGDEGGRVIYLGK